MWNFASQIDLKKIKKGKEVKGKIVRLNNEMKLMFISYINVIWLSFIYHFHHHSNANIHENVDIIYIIIIN